jgi:pSer/pThr/pTyr-binding forkhead associated (FHA) protein
MSMDDATLIKRGNPGFVLRSAIGDEEFVLQGEMLVGREVECAITLNSGHISRYHAKINVSPNGVYLEDLHSTNGTFVNGTKIKGRVRLHIGDEVIFDDLAFRLTSSQAGAAVDTALSPRRQPPIERQPPTPPVHPTPIKIEPQEIEEIPYPTPKAVGKSSPSPKVPAAGVENDRTQMLSAGQLARIFERGRSDQDIQVGSGPRLIVTTAPLRGKLIELKESALGAHWKIGRDTFAEIYLNDKTISTDHARLSHVDTGYLISTTHAKNKLRINGVAVERAFLQHNDKIQVGRTELLFKTDERFEEVDANQVKEILEGDQRMQSYTIMFTTIALVVLITALILTSG